MLNGIGVSVRNVIRFSCLAAIFFAAVSPAHAEIYSWRDANGRLVLSNQKPNGSTTVKTFDVAPASSFRATRYAAPDRAKAYDDLIAEHARRNGVRADLVKAVMQVESAFNPYARSPKGAMGLMQLMPATARQYRVINPYNPNENVRAGVAYLRELLDRYQNNEELALAAYNAGPNAVDRHGQTVPPYRETKNYVANINRLAGTLAEARPSGPRIDKITEVIDGRPVPRYTNQKPQSGSYEVVGQ